MVEVWTREGKQVFKSSHKIPENLIYHRDDGPAYIEYHPDGKKYIEIWYKDGKIHRDGGPASRWYNKDGNIVCEAWFLNGKQHRVDGPAYIEYKLNLNSNSNEVYKFIESWHYNGKKHKDDGPAEVWYDENGAVKCELWYKNSIKHRVEGPAEVWYNLYNNGSTSKFYFINGKHISKEEWEHIAFNEVLALI